MVRVRPTKRSSRARLTPSLMLALLLLGSMAVDGAPVWTVESTLVTSATNPPATFEKGDWSPWYNRWIRSFSTSQDGTSFEMEVKARSGARVHVSDVVRLVNPDAGDAQVTLSGEQVTNPRVHKLIWTVRDGASEVGQLDYKTASPSLTFTLPASTTYEMDLDVGITHEGHRGNVQVASSMEVDPG